jgi:Domain of unknown function (DUF4397)
MFGTIAGYRTIETIAIMKKMMQQRVYLITGIFALVIAGLFSACKKDDLDFGGKAYLLVGNAAPDIASMDVFIDGGKVSGSGISYPGFSGTPGNAYLQVNTGIRSIRVIAGSNTLFDSNINFSKDEHYSLYFYDSLKNGRTNAAIFTDDLSVASPGELKSRILQLAPDTAQLELRIDTSAYLSNILYLGATPSSETFSPFQRFIAGTYKFSLLRTASRDTVFKFPPLALDSGKSYSFVVHGVRGAASRPLGVMVVKHN